MGCGASRKQKEGEGDLDGVMTVKETDEVMNNNNNPEEEQESKEPVSKDEVSEKETKKQGKRNTIVLGAPPPQPGQLGKVGSPSDDTDGGFGTEATLPCDGFNLANGPSKLNSEITRKMHLSFLHFNDVYHIAPSAKEPVGGAPRFSYKVKEYQQAYGSDLMFSGDCYNPSLMSTVTKGKHMTPILNELRMKCAVYGNHDFDFGVDMLRELTAASNCPWLMSNVIDVNDGLPAADGLMSYTYTVNSKQNSTEIKVGVIGLGEEEWLSCVKDLPDNIEYRDAVTVARREATKLREDGCHIIVALTHMRQNNDESFTRAVPEVDVVLGGHDHFYKSQVLESGQLLLKSGTDFKNLSFVAVELREGQRPVFNVERIDITSDIPEDPVVAEIVSGFEESLKGKIGKELCHLECHMDITTETVRTSESGMGNLITDIMRDHCDADCAFVNSGILRADVVYHPSPMSIKDLLDIIPIEDVVVCVEVTGEQILSCVENGLSKWPQHEGRFLQMSGLHVKADPELPSGSRVLQCLINGAAIDNCKLYKASTTAFLCKGCDGFDALRGSRYIIDSENGPVLPTLVRKAIEAMVPKETKVVRRESLHDLKRSMSALGKSGEDFKSAAGHIKRAYLPSVCPQADGRIYLEGFTQPPPQAAVINTPKSVPMMSVPLAGGVSPMIPPLNAPVGGPVNPVVYGSVMRDLAMVKRHFKDLALRISTTNIEWSIELLPYLGLSGQIIGSFPDVGVTQIKFSDNATFWFPSDSIIESDEVAHPSMTPPSMVPSDLRVNELPQRPNSSMGYRKLPRAHTIGEGDMKRRYFPVPKERTLSFIFRPVGTDDNVTKQEVADRGKRRNSEKESQGTIATRESASRRDEFAWETGRPPLIAGSTLWDMAWENALEEAEAYLASGNSGAINRMGTGSPDAWGEHEALHMYYGLGEEGQKAAPLHYAAARGNADMVKLLLSYKADLSQRSDVGFTPRDTACARKALAMLHKKNEVVAMMDTVIHILDSHQAM
eukprot:TRINITY_DN2189_c1_g1_i1.p1 TRINITY_DN2189_c1_g1~~TRINITY_DN2189_c1_g1_i1.p1  ORF type:complete len:1007 (+),score=207.49 TRINITY_DN2189_c1_g1_i1:136-3156(+)